MDEAPNPPKHAPALPRTLRGRGAADNPPNRFVPLHVERDPEAEEEPGPRTLFFRDSTREILARNDSPDIPFTYSLNPYRGCEHGCVYCYARPTHEYLGFSAGLDFESRILVKEDAPELLRRRFSSPSWAPETVSMSGVTDPYQPVERRLGLTRRCLEVFAEFLNPVAVVTKSRLVARDSDLLATLARERAAAVYLSVTTLDEGLRRVLEPRASTPARRLEAVRALAEAGVPVGVLVAPVIPGLNDHELAAILGEAANAGARFAGFVPLRLPHGVAGLFEDWLGRHFPDRKAKVLHQLRSMKGGKLNESRFGARMRGTGPLAEQLRALFRVACRRAGMRPGGPELSTASFRRPQGPQLELF